MTDHVKVIYDNWGNRASLTEPKQVTETERVYEVGGYRLTVPNDTTQSAKCSSIYRSWGASENLMPNMSFSEGSLNIPIEDFVDLILRRVPADELAEGLWRDETVRDRFIECMANRYSGDIEDKDRRKLLDKIQVEIHAKAIDKAIERLNDVESNLRAKSHRSRWEQAQLGHYKGIYERYEALLDEMIRSGVMEEPRKLSLLQMITTPAALQSYVDEGSDPVTKESAGAEWRESRDFWRKRLEEAFPEPTIEGEE